MKIRRVFWCVTKWFLCDILAGYLYVVNHYFSGIFISGAISLADLQKLHSDGFHGIFIEG